MDGLKLVATAATLAFAAAFIACGSNTSAPSTSTATPTATASPPPTPTVEVTKPPLPADAPEVQQVLGLNGFREFASEFAAAVEANDTQFIVDRTYFEDRHCVSTPPAPTAAPYRCSSIGGLPEGPVIAVGAWNSEGDFVYPAGYASIIDEYLNGTTAPDAYIYSLGDAVRGLGEAATGVDIAVANVSRRLSSTGTPIVQAGVALSFRVDVVGGEWRIVEASRGGTSLVPYFYDWYALWDDVFPAN